MTQVTEIRLAALRESPFNPRKTFDEAALVDLSASIASQGLLQPIVVRPAPDRVGDKRNLQVTHEIVFGHRRVRAAQLAGLDTLPAVVRTMTDEEAAIAQVHENTQRADISAIEEADSFAHLVSAHKLKPDGIATAISKSRSYVYGRLKLARMAPEVRKAVTDEGLSPEIALEVARLPHHDLQRKALQQLADQAYTDGGWKTVGWISHREAKRRLKDMFDIHLNDAEFDITDSELVASAGSCTNCPRRAGNDPDLQGVLAYDVCTDKSCYQVKVDAHIQRRIEALKKAGHTVIEGDDAKQLFRNTWSTIPAGYTPVTTRIEDDDDQRTVAIALAELGNAAPRTVFVRNPQNSSLIECVTDSQAKQIVAAACPETATSKRTSTPPFAARALPPAVRAPETPEERALSWPLWDKVQGEIMKRAAARTNRTLDELRWVACALLESQHDMHDSLLDVMGWREEWLAAIESSDGPRWHDEECAFVLDKLKTADVNELATFIVLHAIGLAPFGDGDRADADAQKLAIAAHYGVDVIAAAGLEQQTDDAGAAGEEHSEEDVDDLEEAGA